MELPASSDMPARRGEVETKARQILNRKLRAAFIKGAEEHSWRDHGRGLTDEELRWVMRRYPGDLDEHDQEGTTD